MDQAAAVKRIRAILAGVSGVVAAYSTADEDDNRIPAGVTLADGAVGLVFQGATLQRIVNNSWQRHTYEVVLQVLVAGGDAGMASSEAAALRDAIQTAFLSNVASASGLWNSLVITRHDADRMFEFGGLEYQGFEVALRVSEEGAATVAVGV